MSQITIHKVDEQAHRALPIWGEIAERLQHVEKRAFEFFEKRSCEAGHALEDWLKAEHELFGKPVAELSEHADNYELQVRLPGLETRHVRVTAAPAEILIQTSREQDNAAGKGTVLWSEFGPPELSRRFELPGPIDSARVSATLEKGVLTIFIPKGEPAKPQNIHAAAA